MKSSYFLKEKLRELRQKKKLKMILYMITPPRNAGICSCVSTAVRSAHKTGIGGTLNGREGSDIVNG